MLNTHRCLEKRLCANEIGEVIKIVNCEEGDKPPSPYWSFRRNGVSESMSPYPCKVLLYA